MAKVSKLTNWQDVFLLLDNPNSRPNDYQRMILDALKAGLNNRDASRIFGVHENTIATLKKTKFDEAQLADKEYFMLRARKLGASDEDIAKWFGLDRVDKVTMILARIKE